MFPVIQGIIDRRILVNFRADPNILQKMLPAPFKPKLIHGQGVVGICLIRLSGMRPWFFPPGWGVSSENAAHRIAVEWEEDDDLCQGVYIPRRDTSSRINSLAGGRVFPGVHNFSTFQVEEADNRYYIKVENDGVMIELEASLASELPSESIFDSIEEASAFFKESSLGYSVTRKPNSYHGMELQTEQWHIEPLAVQKVYSSFFADKKLFPEGSIEFDCALLMKDIHHKWHNRGKLCAI